MLGNIPEELKFYDQWVLWRAEAAANGRITKIPYDAKVQRLASVTDPATWSGFFTAQAALPISGCDGTGFIISKADPFTFIDLDDPYATNPDGSPKHKNPELISAFQRQVFERSKSYAEYSPSGRGLHIIARGSVPTGRRRNAIEIYSQERYMTVTGNVYRANGIEEEQELLTWLYEHLGGDEAKTTPVYGGEYVDKEEDNTVLDRAAGAANGDKFLALWSGNWQDHYASQSEADYAIIDMLAFYTQSRFQIARLFRQSGLGKRDKANRDKYVFDMIGRSFDRMPPPLDIEAIKAKLEAQFGIGRDGIPSVQPMPSGLAEEHGNRGAGPLGGSPVDAPSPTARLETPTAEDIDEPVSSVNPYLAPVPGLLGQIAWYIYSQASRQVPEIALAGAIGLMAGICGRAWNVSRTGLNQYILLLAGTGRGKEAIPSGITNLITAVASIAPGGGGCPGAITFLGPDRIASGQALVKHMDKVSRSFVAIQGEFDLTLKTFIAKNTNPGLAALKQTYLASYSRSGRGQVMQSSIYSDRDKNTTAIPSPAFSIVGEGTPERFYALLDETLVADGLLPRFTIIEYDGPRPPDNPNADVPPDPGLIRALQSLCGQALLLNAKDASIDVGYTNEAKALLDAYNVRVDGYINAAHSDTLEQLWNRAHLKALKLAATVAVGINYMQPVIDLAAAKYAIDIVDYDTRRLVAKFKMGDVGEGESKQFGDLRRKIMGYYMDGGRAASAFGCSQEYQAGIIPWAFIQSRCVNLASFKSDRMGKPSEAIRRVVKELVLMGIMAEVSNVDRQRLNLGAGSYYTVLKPAWFNKGD